MDVLRLDCRRGRGPEHHDLSENPGVGDRRGGGASVLFSLVAGHLVCQRGARALARAGRRRPRHGTRDCRLARTHGPDPVGRGAGQARRHSDHARRRRVRRQGRPVRADRRRDRLGAGQPRPHPGHRTAQAGHLRRLGRLRGGVRHADCRRVVWRGGVVPRPIALRCVVAVVRRRHHGVSRLQRPGCDLLSLSGSSARCCCWACGAASARCC